MHTDLTAHQLGQALADGQAQPGAAIAACGGGVGLLEALEQAILICSGRQANTGVAHLEAQQNRIAPCASMRTTMPTSPFSVNLMALLA